jgi:hypothetical protein
METHIKVDEDCANVVSEKMRNALLKRVIARASETPSWGPGSQMEGDFEVRIQWVLDYSPAGEITLMIGNNFVRTDKTHEPPSSRR